MKPHLHFLGIGGVSMSGLARHFHADGHVVSGCDGVRSPTTDALEAAGIEVSRGHHEDHLDGVDALVTSAAIATEEPERVAAEARGIPVRRRIDLLADLFRRYRAIGVTGTHGKSTTSGMVATILLAASEDPAVQLGATLPALGGVMRYGRGPHLVAEVDESDPGFQTLVSEIGIVTNLEDDHVAGEHGERRTYHASLHELEAATRRFADAATHLLTCADWPELTRLVAGHASHRTFGLEPGADYRIRDLALAEDGSRFLLETPEGTVPVRLAVPGRYNAVNGAGALAAADLAGIPLSAAAEALAAFEGVGRRWQRWGTAGGALVVDDYAHHATEVRATLETARATGRRVRVVLQPHRWVRTARHWPELADAAASADEVLVVDVYDAGEDAIPGVSTDLIVARLRDGGTLASKHDLASAGAYLAATVSPDDLVLTLGAGDVWRVAAALSEEPVHRE